MALAAGAGALLRRGLGLRRSGAAFAQARRLSLHLQDAAADAQLHDEQLLNSVAEHASTEAGAGRAQQQQRRPSLLARYQALLASGTLRPDAGQAACVQRLDRLCNELHGYQAAVAGYQQELCAYQRARQERWGEVYAGEDRRLRAEEEKQGREGPAAAEAPPRRTLRSMLGLGGDENEAEVGPSGASGEGERQGEGGGAARHALSPAQRAAILRARTERRLDELLGPAPPPPPAPKGVYIHGSVGSGKSLLMDLLYTTVAQPPPAFGEPAAAAAAGDPVATAGSGADAAGAAAVLPHHRRLHFNSALLELHSRLHELDKHRECEEQRALEEYARASAERVAPAATVAQASGGNGGSALAAAWQQIRDPIAEKLKRSKLAKLAYRRMMRDRASRSVEEHSQALAASNAAVLRHAARALIRNCDTLGLLRRSTAGSGPSEDLDGEDDSEDRQRPDTGRIAALLCFDEMQVNDVFNAVALKGLLEALLDEGCVVVATSNRAPWELNRHGLHEDLFGHFIQHLLASCDVVQLDAEQDYRRLLGGSELLAPAAANSSAAQQAQRTQRRPSYFYPLGPQAQARLQQEWEGVSEGISPGGDSLRVMFGRTLEVRKHRGGAAWFEFEELCGRPLGAADYIAISQAFHTVFLEGVPAMSMKLRDRARRFITMVDEMYNHRVRLVLSAEVPPDELFSGAGEEPIIDLEALQFETAVEGSRLRRNVTAAGGVAPVAASPEAAAAAANLLGGEEERFAFARAVSRLYEMQGELYLHSRPRQ